MLYEQPDQYMTVIHMRQYGSSICQQLAITNSGKVLVRRFNGSMQQNVPFVEL